MTARRLAAALLALLVGAVPAAAEPVAIERDDGVPLRMHWLPAPQAPGPRPAVVALHGCGGLYARDGRTLRRGFLEYAERLHRAGYHVLLPDSFGSRGEGSICTITGAERPVKVEMRRTDVIDAVRWLAQRPEVDARKIALLGWSHGGATALAAINAARGAAPVAGAVVFYASCGGLISQPYRLDAPLLLLLGEKDDWTPPTQCRRWVEHMRAAQPDADITLRVYADSYHGFDSAGPVRLRTDVRSRANPDGVHVGGNPAARAQSQQEMDRFLARVLP